MMRYSILIHIPNIQKTYRIIKSLSADLFCQRSLKDYLIIPQKNTEVFITQFAMWSDFIPGEIAIQHAKSIFR